MSIQRFPRPAAAPAPPPFPQRGGREGGGAGRGRAGQTEPPDTGRRAGRGAGGAEPPGAARGRRSPPVRRRRSPPVRRRHRAGRLRAAAASCSGSLVRRRPRAAAAPCGGGSVRRRSVRRRHRAGRLRVPPPRRARGAGPVFSICGRSGVRPLFTLCPVLPPCLSPPAPCRPFARSRLPRPFPPPSRRLGRLRRRPLRPPGRSSPRNRRPASWMEYFVK